MGNEVYSDAQSSINSTPFRLFKQVLRIMRAQQEGYNRGPCVTSILSHNIHEHILHEIQQHIYNETHPSFKYLDDYYPSRHPYCIYDFIG